MSPPLLATWKMDYGDGRDYGAETNTRIADWFTRTAQTA